MLPGCGARQTSISSPACFIVRGAVDWPVAAIMVAGAILGGYAGARFARFIGRDKARAAVVVIGVLVAVILLIQQARR